METKDKILIVEDDETIAAFLIAVLEANGFDTIRASLGREAVTLISSHCPDLVLLDLGIEGLDPIRVCDVADVVRADNAGEIYASLNGNNGLILMFSKQSNYATAKVSDNINTAFEELSAQYPGLTFTALMDQGDYIYLLRDSILSSLLWGALFSVVILFLFLRDWRPTVITLCSIPISLLFALTLMYFTGVSINIMSLSGLSISVGMLVDNSVVVIENTYRLRALGADIYLEH